MEEGYSVIDSQYEIFREFMMGLKGDSGFTLDKFRGLMESIVAEAEKNSEDAEWQYYAACVLERTKDSGNTHELLYLNRAIELSPKVFITPAYVRRAEIYSEQNKGLAALEDIMVAMQHRIAMPRYCYFPLHAIEEKIAVLGRELLMNGTLLSKVKEIQSLAGMDEMMMLDEALTKATFYNEKHASLVKQESIEELKVFNQELLMIIDKLNHGDKLFGETHEHAMDLVKKIEGISLLADVGPTLKIAINSYQDLIKALLDSKSDSCIVIEKIFSLEVLIMTFEMLGKVINSDVSVGLFSDVAKQFQGQGFFSFEGHAFGTKMVKNYQEIAELANFAITLKLILLGLEKNNPDRFVEVLRNCYSGNVRSFREMIPRIFQEMRMQFSDFVPTLERGEAYPNIQQVSNWVYARIGDFEASRPPNFMGIKRSSSQEF